MVPREPIDAAEVVRRVSAAHEAAAADKGLTLTAEAPEGLVVSSAPGAVETLVEVLVDNAIRYTTSGGIIVRAVRDGADARIEVEDTGPGIPVEERERVFDRFYRGAGAPEGGSGLGLAIAHRLAEAHGGRIELAAAGRGGGLLARVRWPLSRP
jgi:two-component system OmpR family sensor kinase